MDREGGRRLGGGVFVTGDSSALTRTGLPRLWRTEHLQAANSGQSPAARPLSHTLVVQVDVQFVRMMKRFIPLAELRAHHHAHKATGGPLQHMALFTLQRLSVQPLTRGKMGPVLGHPHARVALATHLCLLPRPGHSTYPASVSSPALSLWEEVCPELPGTVYAVPSSACVAHSNALHKWVLNNTSDA